jgi:hypothetical protein
MTQDQTNPSAPETVDITPNDANLRRFMRAAWQNPAEVAFRRSVEADPDIMRFVWPDGPPA